MNSFNFYENELKALKKSSRFRERKIFSADVIDLASNDYLGLSSKKELLSRAYEKLMSSSENSSKSSMLVNGYTQIHKDFEEYLCEVNGFEDAILVGSGFSANIAMIEALVRSKDELFIDEKYHASGILATKLLNAKVTIFKHNDAADLLKKMSISTCKRKIVAVEGIYSMDGDILDEEIIQITNSFNAILIVDEAHSSGVVGENLLGVYDYYNIKIEPNHIKMGTLGKAYGSFGGYILGSSHIVSFLLNRAKSIIYATSPSLIDTLLSHEALKYIQSNKQELKKGIQTNQKLAKTLFNVDVKGLILPIEIGSNEMVMQIQKELLKENILVGAIRQPTVESAIMRVILRVGTCSEELLREVFKQVEFKKASL